MEKKIIKISSSALKESACDWRYKAIVLDGYTSLLPYNDTQYGSAFHKFCYVMALTNGNFAEAHKAAIEKFRQPVQIRDRKEHLTEKHLIATCLTYWDQIESNRTDFQSLINPTNDKPLVEFNFSVPVYEDKYCIVLFEGTIDRIGKIKNGFYCIRDFKTTSSWKAKEFLESFRASPQLKLYLWALKKHASLNPGTILDDIVKFPLAAFIDGVFLKSAKETEFHSSDAYVFKDWEFEEIEQQLYQKALKIVNISLGHEVSMTRNGKIFGECYKGYYCKFFHVCHAIDKQVADIVLKKNFTQRPFDPLNYDGD